MFHASFRSRPEACQLLLSANADLEARNSSDRTVLACAALRGQVNMVNFLVNAGAELDCLDDYQRTPLMCAANEGECDIVDYLASANADLEVSQTGVCGVQTVVVLAALKGNSQIVDTLLRHGADPNATSAAGSSIIELLHRSSGTRYAIVTNNKDGAHLEVERRVVAREYEMMCRSQDRHRTIHGGSTSNKSIKRSGSPTEITGLAMKFQHG